MSQNGTEKDTSLRVCSNYVCVCKFESVCLCVCVCVCVIGNEVGMDEQTA